MRYGRALESIQFREIGLIVVSLALKHFEGLEGLDWGIYILVCDRKGGIIDRRRGVLVQKLSVSHLDVARVLMLKLKAESKKI